MIFNPVGRADLPGPSGAATLRDDRRLPEYGPRREPLTAMRVRWCWRCRSEVPMLDDAEFALVKKAQEEGLDFVEEERKRRGLPRPKPLELPDHDAEFFEGFLAMLEMHRLLTGYLVRDQREAYSHRVSRHGPPCPECDKPLRTSRARFCAACGFGLEGFEDDDRPLVVRAPEAFDFEAFPEGRL